MTAELTTQDTRKPTRKIAATTGIVGAVATLIIAIAPHLGVDIPGETAIYVAGALIAAVGAGYKALERRP